MPSPLEDSPKFFSEPARHLIELGVIAVAEGKDYDDGWAGKFDEPIIVQAGINLIDMEAKLLQSFRDQEVDGQGKAVERLLLLPLQGGTRLRQILSWKLAEKYPEDVESLSYFSGSTKSSYGVLAVDCAIEGGDPTPEKRAVERTIDG